MFRFDNPLDPSKDGMNPFIDGIRYHIRDSESIKEEVIEFVKTKEFWDYACGSEILLIVEILEDILHHLGYKLDDLTPEDQHELIDIIYARIEE